MKPLRRSMKLLSFVTAVLEWPVYFFVDFICIGISLVMLYGASTERSPQAIPFAIGVLLLAATWFHVRFPLRPYGFYAKGWTAVGAIGLFLSLLGGILLIRPAA